MFKPVKLSVFLAKQKLLGLGRRKENYIVYGVDDKTSVVVYDIDLRQSDVAVIYIKSINNKFRVADYFTELDIDTGSYILSFGCGRPSKRPEKASVSLRGVKMPRGVMVDEIRANKIDFGDEIDLVEQLNYNMMLPNIRSIEEDITFNRDISSKRLIDTGIMNNVWVYKTSTLGINEISLSCLVRYMTNGFEMLMSLDLSSIHSIIQDLETPENIRVWFTDLKEVHLSKELAYIVTQLLTYTDLADEHTIYKDLNIKISNKLLINKLGVQQLEFGIMRAFMPNYPIVDKVQFEPYTLENIENKKELEKDKLGIAIKAIYKIEKKALNYYEELVRDKEVRIGITKVVLVD